MKRRFRFYENRGNRQPLNHFYGKCDPPLTRLLRSSIFIMILLEVKKWLGQFTKTSVGLSSVMAMQVTITFRQRFGGPAVGRMDDENLWMAPTESRVKRVLAVNLSKKIRSTICDRTKSSGLFTTTVVRDSTTRVQANCR